MYVRNLLQLTECLEKQQKFTMLENIIQMRNQEKSLCKKKILYSCTCVYLTKYNDANIEQYLLIINISSLLLFLLLTLF